MANKNETLTIQQGHIPMPKLLTVKDLQAYLSISKPYALALLNSGEIKGFKVAGKWKITEKAVIDYIEKQEKEARK